MDSTRCQRVWIILGSFFNRDLVTGAAHHLFFIPSKTFVVVAGEEEGAAEVQGHCHLGIDGQERREGLCTRFHYP